jgi:cytochrome P450
VGAPARPGGDLAAALTDPSLYEGDPYPHYARMRAEAPVAWNVEHGFWAVMTHPEVVRIGADPVGFCSSKGILVEEIGVAYESPPTMMHTDPPVHTGYRRRVQPSFKPTAVRSLEPAVRATARELVGPIVSSEAVDVVQQLAVPFPLRVICRLLGAPEDEWPRFYEWSEAVIPGATDWPEERRSALLSEMWEYLVGLATERRSDPRDDLVSALAAPGPDALNDAELSMFLIQLLVAGNETTRNLLSGGLVALAERPDEWDRLRSDPSLAGRATEELLRWTTPVTSFLRTATADTELRGQPIAAGEPVLLVYASADRDEAVFGPGADRLDVGRDPNPHVAFGFGPHFCLGAALARLEAAVVLDELLARVGSIEPAGPVRRSPSSVIGGVRAAPLRFLPA